MKNGVYMGNNIVQMGGEGKLGAALSQRQMAGLAMVGDWAHQIEGLLTLVQDVLKELPEAIDEDKVISAVRPKLEAVKDTAQEALSLLRIDSPESANERIRDMLGALKRAQLDLVLPQVLDTLTVLHESGALNRVQILLNATAELPQGRELQDLVDKIQHLRSQLPYWTDAAKQALAAVTDVIHAFNLPEKADALQDAADQWLRIAMRMKVLAQGDADSLAARAADLMTLAEYWSAQLAVVIAGLKDMAPEAFNDLDVQAIMGQVKTAANEWLLIAQDAQRLVVGDAATLAERVRRMLAGVRGAHLDEMLPDLINIAGAVHRSGLLKRTNTVIEAIQPHLPSDEELKCWIDEGAVLAKQYQPQLGIALNALQQAQAELVGQERKSGGVMGLLRLLFSRDTQYVLRFLIRFLYNDLKAQKR